MAHSMVSVHIGSEFSTWMYKKRDPDFLFSFFFYPFGFELGPVAHMPHVYVCIEWRIMHDREWLGWTLDTGFIEVTLAMGIERPDSFLHMLSASWIGLNLVVSSLLVFVFSVSRFLCLDWFDTGSGSSCICITKFPFPVFYLIDSVLCVCYVSNSTNVYWPILLFS